MDIVDKLSNDISNYLKNKNIPYITTDELKMAPNKPNNSPSSKAKEENEEDVLSCCDGNVKMERIHINAHVKSISDLLRLCETYELAENVTYNIDMKALHKIYPHLSALNNMIGMPAIKQTIVDQIIYFIQGLHLSTTTATTITTTSGSLPPVHVVKNNKIINNTSPTIGAASFADGLSVTEPMFGPTGAGTATTATANANAKNTKPKDETIASAIFRFPLFNPTNISNIFSPSAPKAKHANKNDGVGAGDYMHTVLYGPPGTGKTEVAKILGNIFCNLGILTSNTFKKVTRSDLVAGYLGQTAIKTREVIESAIGGVLFIDEAYALGNTEKRDSFSKECIDTLCEALSDHKHELMVIIAGYEKELNDCFFSYNEGLSSRFTWRYKIENYDSSELRKIFEKIVKDNGWTFKFDRDAVKDEWFKTRQQYFKYFGRDIEVFFTKTKIAHARRVFYLPVKDRRSLIMEDLDAGFELFTANEEIKSRGNSLHGGPAATMYL
jgi:chromosomal replication initiation ATPase DnaA